MTEKVDLAVGDRVRLLSGGEYRLWWDVRAADDRFVILTRQAEFKPKGELCYTIIDWERGVRGPCNLIGQGWDVDMGDDAVAELLGALQAYVVNTARRRHEFETQGIRSWEEAEIEVEVSYRNNVEIAIAEVRKA